MLISDISKIQTNKVLLPKEVRSLITISVKLWIRPTGWTWADEFGRLSFGQQCVLTFVRFVDELN